jgi:hypothetical protein
MIAYEGSENYIFISYTRKDSATVLPVIDALQKAGFRIWFDRSISGGDEWAATIEDHILRCDTVLVFMSQSTVESEYCRKEISAAISAKKTILSVYLSETKLRYGLYLQLQNIQAVTHDSYKDAHELVALLEQETCLQSCREVSAGERGLRVHRRV